MEYVFYNSHRHAVPILMVCFSVCCVSLGAQNAKEVPTYNAAADKAWGEVERAAQMPEPPASLQVKLWAKSFFKALTTDDMRGFYEKTYIPAMHKGIETATNFYARFPDHPKAVEAHMVEYRLLSEAAHRFHATNQIPRLIALENEYAADRRLAENERFMLRQAQVMRKFRNIEPLNEFERDAWALQKEFPNQANSYNVLVVVMERSDGDRARTLARDILDTPAPESVKADVRGYLNGLGTLGKPLNLKFTAIDGRDVDLSKMKGKVVLIDFWATWCAPCVAGLPGLKNTYEKFHRQGFEIVGISCDTDKDRLKHLIKEKALPWPQYFDGERAKKYTVQFGIIGYPTMWLVDKQGNLRDVSADESQEKVRSAADKPVESPDAAATTQTVLETKVAKLLTEK